MTALGIGPGVVVELAAAQDPREPRGASALHAEAVALALAAVPGLVRGLLLHPELPLAGSLHPALLTDRRLSWCTATEMRRLRAGGAISAVVPASGSGDRRTTGAAVHLADPTLPVIAIDAGTDPAGAVASVVAWVDELAVAEAPPTLRVALSEETPTAVSDALATRCDLTVLRAPDAAPPAPWAFDAWIAHLQGTPSGASLSAAAARHPAVVWLDDPCVGPAALERARAALVPSADAARRLALDRGLDARPLRLAIADPADPDGASAAIAALVAGLAEPAPPPR